MVKSLKINKNDTLVALVYNINPKTGMFLNGLFSPSKIPFP